MGMPLAIAVRLLPTPATVMTWRTPAEHMAWRHRNGRSQPCDLQAAVILLRETAGSPPGPAGIAADRMLPTPDTGTSPRGHGRRGGRPGNGHQSGHDLDAAVRALHPPEPPASPQLPEAGHPRAGSPEVAWGPYETAVRRWEHIARCPAPPPAEPGPGQRLRLAAAFAEWLMGIPGWVTGIPGLPRTAQLRVIGNGVVPQQGAMALRLLIGIAAASPSEPGLAAPAGREAAA
jgi:DNA (cytosine-5)-methyltransferase 1